MGYDVKTYNAGFLDCLTQVKDFLDKGEVEPLTEFVDMWQRVHVHQIGF